jgi:hypothetical protein
LSAKICQYATNPPRTIAFHAAGTSQKFSFFSLPSLEYVPRAVPKIATVCPFVRISSCDTL